MRVAVDLQGAQAANGRRGIGAYARAIVQHLVALAPEHEWALVVNGAFPESVDEFIALVGDRPGVTVHLFQPPDLLRGSLIGDAWLRHATEVVYEQFVADLRPDVVLITSLFEGLADPAVVSIRALEGIPTAVILYDLIPLVRPESYLADHRVRAWYHERIGQLRRADHLLAISEASRVEAIERLDLHPGRATNVSAAVDAVFRPGDVDDVTSRALRSRLGIDRPFVLYNGGIDARKNIDRLIDAFAALPPAVRDEHQLVIVCAVEPDARRSLEARASDAGLSARDLVLTGYVTTSELVDLCRLATASVFPSLHEGFGLPALEAMACGRAVIASDCSSLPEVIGRDDALFDPTSVESISAAIERVLVDHEFRRDLEEHALARSARFSWGRTAAAVLEQLSALAGARDVGDPRVASPRPALAVVSPLPPEASGISDYTAMLLPHLATWYEIDVVTDLPEIADPWIAANCRRRTTAWFRSNGHRYDRVLYQIGNSAFHTEMFDLIADVPGVVTLHDFAVSGIMSYRDGIGRASRPWEAEVYHSHGYGALIADRDATDRSDTVWTYPVNLSLLQSATGVIVHSRAARHLAASWYGAADGDDWHLAPMPRDTAGLPDRSEARQTLGIAHDELLVCAFGIIGPTKLNDRLVDAWAASECHRSQRSRLVFVGEAHDEGFETRLRDRIRYHELGDVTLTGRAAAEVYALHLAAADIAVQLRARSRGETSASAFDCLGAGVATIVNESEAFSELPDGALLVLDAEVAVEALTDAINSLATDGERRALMGAAGRRYVRLHHRPSVSAAAIHAAIEASWSAPSHRRPTIGARIVERAGRPQRSDMVRSAASSAMHNLRVRPRQPHLYVDVSELARHDAGTGIQRVTRNLLRWLVTAPPAGYRVEPVAATETTGYAAARSFTASLLDLRLPLADEDIDPAPGDIFLGLDLQPTVVRAQRDRLRQLRRHGVQTAFVVYDLLPILAPEHFYPGAKSLHTEWMQTVREADGLIAISQSVRDEVQGWLDANPSNERPPLLGWFHLGADLDGIETHHDPVDDDHPARMLMVGTIEPRKRHAQVLDAMERLWVAGIDAELVIAGRHGWMMEEFIQRMQRHPEHGRRLHWLPELSDDELAHWYRSSSALIAASTGEGFGLPIIEAAHFGLPIIARDLPVFREVAGDHATYFEGDSPEALSGCIIDWLELRRIGSAPTPAGLSWNTWRESAEQLRDELWRLLRPRQ
ncbi:MAG: glycosyltransferase [Actinobacteria bacterium]|uniref:Unannotated protein n=1 Tax=freshwater metagenome TaxID=449393 RepID=A0A6J6DCM3_9ZZZZ|nr:glycosyltransferase [Actinomycetota bacterium]